jgi:hypothetical protein
MNTVIKRRENNGKAKNTEQDDIEWVPKQEIYGKGIITSKPYDTNYQKSKVFGPGSAKHYRYRKAKSGVMTHLP